jgi:hypothetical protein
MFSMIEEHRDARVSTNLPRGFEPSSLGLIWRDIRRMR